MCYSSSHLPITRKRSMLPLEHKYPDLRPGFVIFGRKLPLFSYLTSSESLCGNKDFLLQETVCYQF